MHEGDAEGHSGVERAAGNGSERKGHRGHSEADGEAVVGVAGSGFGGGHVQDDIGESEGADELSDERVDGVMIARGGSDAFEVEGEESGAGGAEGLADPIRNDIGGRAASTEKDGEGDSGIIMAAGNVAASVHHDHECRPDGERGQVAGIARADHGHADSKDEKERADELDEVFIHRLGSVFDSKGSQRIAECTGVARGKWGVTWLNGYIVTLRGKAEVIDVLRLVSKCSRHRVPPLKSEP